MDALASGPIIIAVDGPAAAGKGTLSRRLAHFYDLAYLDTGALYRAVGWSVLHRGGNPRNSEEAVKAARELDMSGIESHDIRTGEIGRAASIVAADPGVRAALLDFQRNFAKHPPHFHEGKVRGAVLDGRDIGTVVCPDASVKLFVMADLEERARRRWVELSARDASLSLAQVIEDLRRRDTRDSSRNAAPLKPAADAEILDTSKLSIEDVVARSIRMVDAALARRQGQ
ncbi:MAG: (d)CMP kinase [Parvularculaceae bacterium]